MKIAWKQTLMSVLALCFMASGCGGGGGGETPAQKPKSDLPVRKEISTPVASSFKVDGRTVNIYEYTGLTFKDQTLWTQSLAVDGDRIYFFGFDNKDKEYRTKLRRVHYKDETLSGLAVLDERANWRDRIVVSDGKVYDWHRKGDYSKEKKSSASFWHYYDGKAMVATDLTTSMTAIGQGKKVVYVAGPNYCLGTLDKGSIIKEKELMPVMEVKKDGFNIKGHWADKDGFYLMGYLKNDKGENTNMVRQYSLDDGKLLQTFDGPPTKEGHGFAVTEHRVVMGQEGGRYWIYSKKDGKLLGKAQTEPKLTMEILAPMKDDSILIYRRLNRSEAKLYRMDL